VSGTNRGVSANQAWLSSLGGIPLKKPLVDKETVGDYYCRVGVFISAGVGGGMPIAIELPRKPSFFFYTTDSGEVVYQTPADFANSTGTTFYCRARLGASDLVSANVTLLIG
jgi:hypothetical protein